MNKIIVEPKTKEELESLSEFLKEKKIHFITEEDYEFERRMQARKELVKLAESSPKIDISEEEISAIVNEVRAKRYEEKNRH